MDAAVGPGMRCVGVSHSYSVAVSHNTSSTIDSFPLANRFPARRGPNCIPGNGNVSFSQDYLANSVSFLAQLISLDIESNSVEFDLNQPNERHRRGFWCRSGSFREHRRVCAGPEVHLEFEHNARARGVCTERDVCFLVKISRLAARTDPISSRRSRCPASIRSSRTSTRHTACF